MSPESRVRIFLSSQGAVIALLIILWIVFFKKRTETTQFKKRESDRIEKVKPQPNDDLAQARIKVQKPLALPGIRIDGSPYEILGVAPEASEKEIQTAYRELMKRFHPDRVGPPGSREWKDAEKITHAIIRAKDSLIKKNPP